MRENIARLSPDVCMSEKILQNNILDAKGQKIKHDMQVKKRQHGRWSCA
jgi:hypothetical protein